MELLDPYEINTGSLFGPVGELIDTSDDVDLRAFRTQSGQEVWTSSCRRWRLKDSFPMKIISVNEQTVFVEILKNFESGATEDRIFPISLFEGYETPAGSFFKLQVLESSNSLMFEVWQWKNDPEEHFPNFDFGTNSQQSVSD